MCDKPFPVLPPVGAKAGQEVPESLRMVHMFKVGQFVHYDVIHNIFRRHQQFPVDRQVARGGGAGPALPLPPDDYPVIAAGPSQL